MYIRVYIYMYIQVHMYIYIYTWYVCIHIDTHVGPVILVCGAVQYWAMSIEIGQLPFMAAIRTIHQSEVYKYRVEWVHALVRMNSLQQINSVGFTLRNLPRPGLPGVKPAKRLMTHYDPWLSSIIHPNNQVLITKYYQCAIKYWPILNHWFSDWEAPCKHHLAGRFRAEPPLVLPAGLLPSLSLLGPWDSAHCYQSVRWSLGGKDLPSDHQIWRSGKWITYQWCSY